MDMKDILARIDQRLEELGSNHTDRSLSLAAGMSADGIRNWRRSVQNGGRGNAKAGSIASVANCLGVSETWLMTGKGTGEERLAIDSIELSEPREPGSMLVPVFDVSASAGHGALVDQEVVVDTLAFPPSYLRKLTSSAPDNLAIISVHGESMEPTLLDGDVVLLDRSKTDLSYDGLFVLRFNNALHVKRVGRAAKRDHVTILSDNKDLYPAIPAHIDDVEAVGKVLWYGRKV